MINVIFLNIFVFVLLRFLIKKNIYITVLGFFSVFLQTLVLLSIPFRNRSTSFTSTFSFDFFLFLLLFIFLIPILFKLIVKFCFNQKFQQNLIILEQNVNTFLYNIIFEILEKLTKFLAIKKFLLFLENKITSIVFDKLNIFILFIIIPWLSFIVCFIFDFLQGSFHYSIYAVANYFFLSKIFSFFLFVAKNNFWNNFNQLYYNNCYHLYFSTISMINVLFLKFQFLVNLIFLPPISKKTLRDKIIFWKSFNKMLYFFIYFILIKNIWENTLPLLKNFLNILTINILLIAVFFHWSFVLGFWFVFVLIFVIPRTYKTYCEKVYIFDGKLIDFLKRKDGFLKDYRENLISDFGFTSKDFESDFNETLVIFPKINLFLLSKEYARRFIDFIRFSSKKLK